jgi:restriction system protein
MKLIYSYILIAIVIGSVFMYYLKVRETRNLRTSVYDLLTNNQEMQQTLAMGLYMRFRADEHGIEEIWSSIFLKGTPIEFESFVAKIMGSYYGGQVSVAPPSGDFGIDIEHTRPDGLYLGQVKCYQSDLPFDSIAIVHSQMVKQNARGGFVVTTGSFTESTRQYADGLNIDLIDGYRLVQFWANVNENELKQIKKEQHPVV